MHDVNWWLMALAFLLGLVLTFLLMIGRVTREVPIYAALGRGPKVDVKAPAVDVKKPAVDVKAPDVDVKKGAPVAAAAAAAALFGAAPSASAAPALAGDILAHDKNALIPLHFFGHGFESGFGEGYFPHVSSPRLQHRGPRKAPPRPARGPGGRRPPPARFRPRPGRRWRRGRPV